MRDVMMNPVQEGLSILREKGPGEFVRAVSRYLYYRFIGAPLRDLYRRIRFRRAAPARYRLLHIDPKRVTHVLAPQFLTELTRWDTHIVGGDWDRRVADDRLVFAGSYESGFDSSRRQLVPFENYVFYQSCLEHFNEDVPWTDTEFFTWILNNTDKDIYRYETFEAIQERLTEVDSLYERTCTDGYKTQAELGTGLLHPAGHDEVMVNIGRDGRFVLDDGRHRLVIAKILDLDRIPVRVFVRHPEWQKRRSAVATGSSTPVSDETDGKLVHPDLRAV